MDNTFGLLIYTYNDTGGIRNTLQRFEGYVDEFCIVDKSNNTYHDLLLEQVRGYQVKIVRVMDLGIPDLYHSVPLKIMNSEYIFRLYVGEEASEELIMNLRRFNKHSGYWIRSIERPFMSKSWQLRIYRRDSITFKGFIHEQGDLRDSVKIKKKRYFILQDSDLGNSSKVRRYMAFDLIERPFTYDYLSKKIPFIKLFYFWKNKIISPFFYNFYLKVYQFYSRLQGVSSEEVKYPLDYLKLHYSILREMDSDLLAMCLNIYNEIKEIGPINYLCLFDIAYVKSIVDKDFFNEEGLKIFFYLLHHRFTTGKCAHGIDRRTFHENPLYSRLLSKIERNIASSLPSSRWSRLKNESSLEENDKR